VIALASLLMAASAAVAAIDLQGPTDDLVVPGFVGEPIADPQPHWEDTSCARRIGRRCPSALVTDADII